MKGYGLTARKSKIGGKRQICQETLTCEMKPGKKRVPCNFVVLLLLDTVVRFLANILL